MDGYGVITVVMSPDEEVGSLAERNLLTTLGAEHDVVLSFEGPGQEESIRLRLYLVTRLIMDIAAGRTVPAPAVRRSPRLIASAIPPSLAPSFGATAFAVLMGRSRRPGLAEPKFAVGPSEGWLGVRDDFRNWLMRSV